MKTFRVLFTVWVAATCVLTAQVLREDFREGAAHWPVGTNDVLNQFLTLHRYGDNADMLKLSYHPNVKGDPHYVWNGQCESAVMLGFHFAHPLDLSGPNAVVNMRTKVSGDSSLHVALRVGDDWFVQERGKGKQKDWGTTGVLLHGGVNYRSLDVHDCKIGEPVKGLDFTQVNGLGFLSPKPAKRSRDCTRLDWFEIRSSYPDVKITKEFEMKRQLAEPKFIEDEVPYFRSAMVFEHKGKKYRIPRGVIVRLGYQNSWACFDPDRLSWVAVWVTPKGQSPITLDSMAGVSFPDEKAKASKPPRINGEVIKVFDQSEDIKDLREVTLNGSKEKVGSQPSSHARWLGVRLDGDAVVLKFQKGKDVHTTRISANETFQYKILRKTIGNGNETSEVLDRNGKLSEADGLTNQLDNNYSSAPIFPSTWSSDEIDQKKQSGPFDIRGIPIPKTPRPIRPTDMAFSKDGKALILTLDGDVWQVDKIHSQGSEWTRVAFGIFEPMAIEVSQEGRIYTLGRDQITELIDHNGDGHIDEYRCASDAFIQTLHVRDYSMSMQIGDDGSFYVAKAGIIHLGDKEYREMSGHRGAVLKISPDGKDIKVLAEGLRVPNIGMRDDGRLFASDQQGHYVPTTPIYEINKGDSFGFAPTKHSEKNKVLPPLVNFPYQHNRSAAGFFNLPASKKLKDFSPGFVHVSWDGRLFSVLTPDVGMAFAYRWPLQLGFPSLHAEIHPLREELYVIGLGISGYKPTTPRTVGLAAISQSESFPTPVSLDVKVNSLVIGWNRALEANETVKVASSGLRLYNVQRTQKYGSGHFQTNGKSGEHTQQPVRVMVAPDRKSVTLDFVSIFKADVFDLKLEVSRGEKSASINIYTNPQAFKKARAEELAKISKTKLPIKPGSAKKGGRLFKSYACAGCHSLNDEKLTGPPLKGLASRLSAKKIRESILDPAKVVTKGYPASMPSFEGVMSDQELEDLMAYLKTLKN